MFFLSPRSSQPLCKDSTSPTTRTAFPPPTLPSPQRKDRALVG